MHKAATLEDLDLALATAASSASSLVAVFTAGTCGICQQAVPDMEELSKEFSAKGLQFVHVDIDESPETAVAYEIGALPTFKVYRIGAEVGAMRGANLHGVRNLCERELAKQPHVPSAADSTHRKQARADRSRKENRAPMAKQQAQRAALATMLSDGSNRDGARNALTTLLKLVSNVIESPAEPKFRAVKAENKAVKEKILSCTGARELLLAAGFEHRHVGSSEQPELYVLPEGEGTLADLIEVRIGIETVLGHMNSTG